MSCSESCCLSQLESDVRPISRLFSPPWQGWGHFSVHECVSCIHEAFWHHSPFCYELDLGSALLSAAIWCGGKRLSKRERDWGTEAEGRKKSNGGRWNWFIFRAKGASDWDWWRGGGCLGIENCLQSRRAGCSDDSRAVLALQAQRLKISMRIFVILVMLPESLTAPAPQHRNSAASVQLVILQVLENKISLPHHVCVTVKC